ncbi:hypothetical protein MNBD_ALPHA12-484, partial [hydrothermal vent metagenome]
MPRGGIYLPRAPYHNQHDGLKPPYVDCWRSGGALGCQRRALRSLRLRLISFPILCMGTTHGGGAGDGSEATNGGRNFM